MTLAESPGPGAAELSPVSPYPRAHGLHVNPSSSEMSSILPGNEQCCEGWGLGIGALTGGPRVPMRLGWEEMHPKSREALPGC